jgi:hypothetical protein
VWTVTHKIDNDWLPSVVEAEDHLKCRAIARRSPFCKSFVIAGSPMFTLTFGSCACDESLLEVTNRRNTQVNGCIRLSENLSIMLSKHDRLPKFRSIHEGDIHRNSQPSCEHT